MSSDSGLGKNIPHLNGLNYATWSIMMKAYFQTLGIWAYVRTDHPIPCPVDGQGGATATDVNAWHIADNHAQGIITLYSDGMITLAIESKDTATAKWADLKIKYSSPSAMMTFLEFQQLIRIQIKPKDNFNAKITEINMIFQAIHGQGFTLEDKMKVLILIHTMTATWDHGPMNILSSLAPTQLNPNHVIPRMKELWAHKSGTTSLPTTMGESSGTQVKHELNSLLNHMNKPLCQICKGKHATQDHQGGGHGGSHGGRGRGRGQQQGGAPYPPCQQQQQNDQGQSSGHGQGQNCRHGKGKAQANTTEVEGQEAEAYLADIPEEPQEEYYELNAASYALGARMPTPKLTQEEYQDHYHNALTAHLSEGATLQIENVLIPSAEGLDDEYVINPSNAAIDMTTGDVLDWYMDAIKESTKLAVEVTSSPSGCIPMGTLRWDESVV
ncbi:hypothetical protein BKA82DRAFT_4359642 [Pisolithus tinctorius]|nr:hypothetical protein BKA82DRAFT_4359642 [Pisolithus tinctorius]